MGLTLISLAYAATVVMQADTSRPPIPNTAVAGPGPILEIPARGNSRFTYHRNRFDVWFADSASGVAIRSFLTRFEAMIVGGFDLGPGNAFYIVLVPDPGPTWGAIDSLVQSMVRHRGVVRVGPSAFRSLILRGQAQADTSVPAILDGFTPPANPLLVALPSDTSVVLYRDVVVIAFAPGTSGAAIRSLFQRYGAQVVGGNPFMGTYYLRLPDPGPSYAQARTVERALQQEPGVAMAGLVYERGRSPEPNLSILSGDTSVPQIPSVFVDPRDPTRAAPVTGDSTDLRYRNLFDIAFASGTSGAAIRAVLQEHGATIVGGRPVISAYVVQTADPGSFAGTDSIAAALRGEAGVIMVRIVPFSQGQLRINGRFPRDGASYDATRTQWFGQGSEAIAIRSR